MEASDLARLARPLEHVVSGEHTELLEAVDLLGVAGLVVVADVHDAVGVGRCLEKGGEVWHVPRGGALVEVLQMLVEEGQVLERAAEIEGGRPLTPPHHVAVLIRLPLRHVFQTPAIRKKQKFFFKEKVFIIKKTLKTKSLTRHQTIPGRRLDS